MLESSYAIYGSNKYTQTLPLQIYSACMIEPVNVELVEIILLFRFMDQYIRLTNRPSLPE